MAAMSRSNSIMDLAQKLIVRYFPVDTYHTEFERREGVEPGTDIIIYNNKISLPNSRESSCIQCELYDRHPLMLHIESLKQCGLNGTSHLERLIDFSKACGLSLITLQDGSRITYATEDGSTDTSISLKQLRRLMTGQSWYEKFGFTNKTIVHNLENIKRYIDHPIGDMYPLTLIYRIQDYLSEVNLAIAKDKTSDITKSLPVQTAVFYLYEYLRKTCSNRKCPSDEDLEVVDDIDNILDELYQGMLLRLRLKDTDFNSLELILRQSNQKGSSRKTRRTRRQHNKKTHMTSRRKKRTHRRT
jgi:hypothetical protein